MGTKFTPSFSDEEITQVKSQISAIHAQLYSTFAERKNVVSELLRWRSRLQSGKAFLEVAEVNQHLVVLKTKSRNLRRQKADLETKQAYLIDMLNFGGYSFFSGNGDFEATP